MSENNVPNLDCMDTDELRDFWKKYRVSTPALTRELFGDDSESIPEGTTEILACYALHKAGAQTLRLEGNIVQAFSYERICDNWYHQLPPAARW